MALSLSLLGRSQMVALLRGYHHPHLNSFFKASAAVGKGHCHLRAKLETIGMLILAVLGCIQVVPQRVPSARTSQAEMLNLVMKLQDPVTVLPWLKAKQMAYSNPPFARSDPSTLEHHQTEPQKKWVRCDINESSSLVSASANLRSSPERETIRHERRSMVIDINVACDLSMVEPEEPAAVEKIVTEKVMEPKTINIRNHIDLNSCITEDEETVSAEAIRPM
ncbi:hypothetical protein HAX54_033341 [Datura stramonium]|uniref:Uncharacterized protein n=1 Tax=Datura stramonium TaxID=4076 RepID=A0ABS8SDD7_DATST|nr:hypothetical protein [Datura stramonium]